MQPTIDYMISRYHLLNKKYFNNKITGEIEITFDKFDLDDMLGYATRKKTVSLDYPELIITNIIKINSRLINFDISEYVIDTILAHEMIHLSLFNYKKKLKSHGYVFQKECKRIKKLNPNLDLCYKRCTSLRQNLIVGYL